MFNCSVILRFTNRSKKRERDLKILLSHICRLKNLEIIIVVMERDVDLSNFTNARKIFIDEPFESSKANNIGADASTTDVLVFQDADIIFKSDCYGKIINNLKNYDSVRVGENCVNLGEIHVKKLIGSPINIDHLTNKRFRDCIRDAPGAAIALNKRKFIEIGGYSELFKVYGWEDCYFRYKVKKLTKQMCLNEQMIHLPHEVNYQAGKQPVNAKLYHEIIYTDDGDCIKLSNRDRAFLLKKYKNLSKYFAQT
jgi:predicted glycosyltransferase involved in capsule biosynthesis